MHVRKDMEHTAARTISCRRLSSLARKESSSWREGKHENGLEEGAEPFAPIVAALPRRPASAVSAAAPAAAAAAAYLAAVHFECDSVMAEPGHAPAILANCFEMCALEKRRSGGRRGMQNH